MTKAATPEVSVNLVVYNTAQYLPAAVSSILGQSLAEFELIIIDDGSTDGSWGILQKFAQDDGRIKLFQQENKGVAAARNLALQHSCAEYIAVMDSDDISLPTRLSVQKNFLDQHPEIDAVGSQWLMITPDGKAVGIDTHATNPADIETLMYAYFSLHHPTTMIRRAAIENVGGYNEDPGRLCVDYHLFMQMQLSGCQFANLPLVLFKWRLNPDSITHSKANRQTSFVIQTRDDGFSQLLEAAPDKAHTIARKITLAFPSGTWQDNKIQKLFPEYKCSLLNETWLSQAILTPEERLYRAIILWLKSPEGSYQNLSAQLQAHDCYWLASLVDAQQAKSDVNFNAPLSVSDEQSAHGYTLTLFVPFVKCADDFSQRLQQAQRLQADSNTSLQILVFAASTREIPSALVTKASKLANNLIVITSPLAWEQALKNASGEYFIYLEEYFRFQIERLVSLLATVINSDNDLVYLLDKRYFSTALDESGSPLLDNSPVPKWTRTTLLGKDRLALSGFIHKRSLLDGIKINLDECDFQASRGLARHLALHHQFDIYTGAIDYFIPALDLNSTPLPALHKNLLDWYIDFAMTQLPAKNTWERLPVSKINKYAQTLSAAWVKNDLLLFPANISTIRQLYLDKVSKPLIYPLFRHLLVHDKKTILTSLWHKKKAILLLSASCYCLAIIIRNRISRLSIQ